jgi:ureidoacrylate peracid hydrolase
MRAAYRSELGDLAMSRSKMDRKIEVGDPQAGRGEPVILPLPERLSPAHTALIIVDMQYDFCVEGFGAHAAGRPITIAQSIIPNIQKLLAAARAAGMPVAHVGLLTLANHGSDSGPWLAQRRRSTYSSETLCLDGTKGATFIDELKPAPGEWTVYKHRYSAFTGTNLDTLLRSRGVRTVVITGVSTNACIDSTMRAAFEHEYYVSVPRDGVASWDQALHEATLANVNHRIGITPTVAEILGIWQTRSIKDVVS